MPDLDVMSGNTNKEAVMADDQKPDPKPEPDTKPDAKPDPDAGAKKALDEERKARREAEKLAKDLEARLKELEDKDKSEVEKLRDEVTELTKKLGESDAKTLRSEVAIAKGLTAAQAKRLVGTTREELETDADEILEAFPTGGGTPKPPPSRKPAPNLRGGTEPDSNDQDVETDPAKLAANVPRF